MSNLMVRLSCILGFFLLARYGFSQIEMPEIPSFVLEQEEIVKNHHFFEKSYSELLNRQKVQFKIDPNSFSWHLPESNSFFCEIEYKIHQASRIPFKFRLGSLSYVNKLEGKEIYEALPFPYLQKAGLRRSEDR